MGGVCAHRHLSTPSAALVGSDLRMLSLSREGSSSRPWRQDAGGGGRSEWLEPSAWAAVAAENPPRPTLARHAALWPKGVVVGAGPVPRHLAKHFHAAPVAPSPSQVSLSPSRYKAWESQPRKIRSQFQPVPTERSYQDGTCRMEYFKLYLSPDRGHLIAAPSRRCGGGAGREVGASPATALPALWADTPPGRTPGAETRGPSLPLRLDYRALGTERGGRGAG